MNSALCGKKRDIDTPSSPEIRKILRPQREIRIMKKNRRHATKNYIPSKIFFSLRSKKGSNTRLTKRISIERAAKAPPHMLLTFHYRAWKKYNLTQFRGSTRRTGPRIYFLYFSRKNTKPQVINWWTALFEHERTKNIRRAKKGLRWRPPQEIPSPFPRRKTSVRVRRWQGKGGGYV